jgi:hypothetical protein
MLLLLLLRVQLLVASLKHFFVKTHCKMICLEATTQQKVEFYFKRSGQKPSGRWSKTIWSQPLCYKTRLILIQNYVTLDTNHVQIKASS